MQLLPHRVLKIQGQAVDRKIGGVSARVPLCSHCLLLNLHVSKGHRWQVSLNRWRASILRDGAVSWLVGLMAKADP